MEVVFAVEGPFFEVFYLARGEVVRFEVCGGGVGVVAEGAGGAGGGREGAAGEAAGPAF